MPPCSAIARSRLTPSTTSPTRRSTPRTRAAHEHDRRAEQHELHERDRAPRAGPSERLEECRMFFEALFPVDHDGACGATSRARPDSRHRGRDRARPGPSRRGDGRSALVGRPASPGRSGSEQPTTDTVVESRRVKAACAPLRGRGCSGHTCPRTMSTNASRYDHQVLIHAATITTPNDCGSVLATATTLRELEMRRSSLRSGGRGLPRSLRRSVGRTSGSASAGGTIVRCAGGLAICVMGHMLHFLIVRSTEYKSTDGTRPAQPALDRALGASRQPPAGDVGEPIARLHVVVRDQRRHDTHGTVADGRPGRTHERRRRLPAERSAPRTAVATGPGREERPITWDGTWWFVAVLAERRSVADRRSFRSRAEGARLGELRPDTWLRPANIDVPGDLTGAVTAPGSAGVRRRCGAGTAAVGPRRTRCHGVSLVSALQSTSADLRHDQGDSALARAFAQLAACQRFLRTEPQLPESLDPGRSSVELRTAYADVVVSFQQRLARVLVERRRSVATPTLRTGGR